MTPEEEGAFIRLLCYAWKSDDCSLPDDDEILSVYSRLGEKWYEGSGDRIRKCFVLKGGKLYNKRLLIERKKQREFRKKCSIGGMNSAKARKNKILNKGEQLTDLNNDLEAKSNITSSSTISTTNKDIYKKIKYLEFIYLSEKEYLKLIEIYGKEIIDKYIEKLNYYIGSKNLQKKYKNHYFTILSWLRKDEIEKLKKKEIKLDDYEIYRRKLLEENKDLNNEFYNEVIKKIADENLINLYDFKHYIKMLAVVKETKNKIFLFSRNAEYTEKNIIDLIEKLSNKNVCITNKVNPLK